MVTIKLDFEKEELEKLMHKIFNETLWMQENSIKVLEENNANLAMEVIKHDEVVNNLTDEITDKIVLILAQHAPVASDLRLIVSTLQIISEVERISDYAKSISEYIIINKDPIHVTVMDYIKKMHTIFIDMFKSACEAYFEADIDKALETSKKDKEINLLYKEVTTLMVKSIYANEDANNNTLERIFSLTNLLKRLERCGDHTKNMCEAVVLLVKGRRYELD